MTQIEEVKSRLDIVELVGGYVTLQRSGSSFKANCPFHQERTPSFYVFPDRQSWRCFGACAEGGDAFGFVMKAEKVEFREALQRLAARAGVTLEGPGESGGGRARQLYEINDAARRFYQEMLAAPEGEFVRAYLDGRGIAERSRQIFEFGYSPARGNRLLEQLTGLGYTPEQAAEAGLARQTDEGRYYDLFRGRLMIPIRDWQARMAGFGSRALDDNAAAKYLNTPRTPVFDKSRILYAMHLAKEPARQQGAVIVEGYLDAVTAHQHGFDNVVASMGTALTEQQVAQLRRITNRVTMALDGDPAGRNATLRSLEASWGIFQQRSDRAGGASVLQPPAALELLIAELPAGQDPDDFIRQTPREWAAFVAGAAPLFEYLLTTLSARADVENPDGRAWVARTMLRFIAQIPDRIRRDTYIDDLAARLGLNEATLRAAMPETMPRNAPASASGRRDGGEGRGRGAPATADDAGPGPLSPRRNALEEHLLAILCQHGAELGADAAVDVSRWLNSENRELYYGVINGVSGGDYGDGGEGLAGVAPELAGRLAELRRVNLRLTGAGGLRRAWQQVCLTLESNHLKRENQELTRALADTGQWGAPDYPESPVVARLRDNKNRIGEIDRLRQPERLRQS